MVPEFPEALDVLTGVAPSVSQFFDQNLEILLRVVEVMQVVPSFLEWTFRAIVEVISCLEIVQDFLFLKFFEKYVCPGRC